MKKKTDKIGFKKYFKELLAIEDIFYSQVSELEKKMQRETSIEGIEFFWSDNAIVGIGTVDRKMKLVQRDG